MTSRLGYSQWPALDDSPDCRHDQRTCVGARVAIVLLGIDCIGVDLVDRVLSAVPSLQMVATFVIG